MRLRRRRCELGLHCRSLCWKPTWITQAAPPSQGLVQNMRARVLNAFLGFNLSWRFRVGSVRVDQVSHVCLHLLEADVDNTSITCLHSVVSMHTNQQLTLAAAPVNKRWRALCLRRETHEAVTDHNLANPLLLFPFPCDRRKVLLLLLHRNGLPFERV